MPVPGAGSRWCPGRGQGCPGGQRDPGRRVCTGHAGGQQPLQSPDMSSRLGGCRLGLPILWWGGGHRLGAKSNGSGDGQPLHRAAFTAAKHTSFLMHHLSWKTLAIPPQTWGERLHPEQCHGGPGCGDRLGGVRPWSGMAPAPREPLCWGTAGLTPALCWGHSSPCCLVCREWGRGRKGLL